MSTKKENLIEMYKTKKGVKIFVSPGKKSKFDFRVRYQELGKHVRTPKHIHWTIDLYIKREHEKDLTNKLVDALIDITKNVQPSHKFPPDFQFFTKMNLDEYEPLDKYGEYSSDFLVATIELIMIQEKTNYPQGTMNLKLLEAFRDNKGIFEVVSRATFR